MKRSLIGIERNHFNEARLQRVQRSIGERGGSVQSPSIRERGKTAVEVERSVGNLDDFDV